MIALEGFDTAKGLLVCKRLTLTLFILFALSSCRAVSIADDINQTQANQIVALLHSHGISAYARHDSAGKDKYSIEVDRSYYSQAKTLLAEKNWPGPIKPNISELTASRGLIPNSREMESLRIDNARAVEVEEILQAHPSILMAKAVVHFSAASEDSQRGVSIILQTRNGSNLNKADIEKIVAHVLPGVSSEKILVDIQEEVKPDSGQEIVGVLNDDGKVQKVPLVPFLFNWKVPEDDYNAMVYILITCFALLAIIGGLIGYWFGYYMHSKQFLDVGGIPDLSARSLRLDKPSREMPEV